MRHVFLINPAAGKYDRTGEFTQTIRAACEGLDYEILVSRAPGDCTHIAQAAASSGEPVRLYACGGDGTLNEVVNGAAGHANAAVTHFPGGSGNDFIKIFSDPAAFRSLPRLLDAEEATFDLIRCNGQNYAVNICSMGFDARIGTEIGRYKRLPLVSGTGARQSSAQKIAETHGVSRASLYKWKKQLLGEEQRVTMPQKSILPQLPKRSSSKKSRHYGPRKRISRPNYIDSGWNTTF